jgi:hypothetical protein
MRRIFLAVVMFVPLLVGASECDKDGRQCPAGYHCDNHRCVKNNS